MITMASMSTSPAFAFDPYAPAMPPGQDELPCEDGVPMETPKHRQQMSLLIESLQAHLHDRPDVYIGGNMGVYFSMTQVKNNDFRAPDFFVAFDVVQGRERKSWVVWEEDGVAPGVVIELLSETTEREDRGRKMVVYAKALRVKEYYLFDPHSLVLEGYVLHSAQDAYRRLTPQANGGFLSEKLGLQLVIARGVFWGVETDWLRFATLDGTILPSTSESANAARALAVAAESKASAAESKATVLESRATAAETKAAKLAERLRALGHNPDDG